MPEEQSLKNMRYNILVPLLLEWEEDDTKKSSLVFLDLASHKAYSADGQEVFGQAVNHAFRKIRGPSGAAPLPITANLYEKAMSLQQKLYEENKELIDGTKRSESGRIRAWSGGPNSGDPPELGQQED